MNRSKFMFGFALGAALGTAGGFMLHENKARIKAKMWYLKMRADIERQLRGLKKFTREVHDTIIENALKEYGSKAEISAAKLGLIELKLKGKWKEAKRRFEAAAQAGEDSEEDEDEEE